VSVVGEGKRRVRLTIAVTKFSVKGAFIGGRHSGRFDTPKTEGGEVGLHLGATSR
jgi:hypothetical protein